ncbi:hypothetical protein [Alkalicoccobacillus porphyridii]|nr:hypothetical protein [Alkalicoccobacillus porphyridii]
MFAEHKISRVDGLTGYIVDELNGVILVLWEDHHVEEYVSEQTDMHW